MQLTSYIVLILVFHLFAQQLQQGKVLSILILQILVNRCFQCSIVTQWGGNLEPVNLTPLFKWENYSFEECVVDTYGEYIIVSAKTLTADENDTMFLVNVNQKYSVDIIPYGLNTFAKNAGILYGGDSFSDTVYSLFTGFDDLTLVIQNQWTSKAQTYKSENLKKFRFLRFKGLIDPQQYIEVYASFDSGDFQLLGTIRGDGGLC